MATGIKLTVQISFVDDWLKVEIPLQSFAIKAAKITFNTDATTAIYLDRLEILARAYAAKKLTLERLVSEYTRGSVKHSAEFGNIFERISDTIADKVQPGDIAASIFAKQ